MPVDEPRANLDVAEVLAWLARTRHAGPTRLRYLVAYNRLTRWSPDDLLERGVDPPRAWRGAVTQWLPSIVKSGGLVTLPGEDGVIEFNHNRSLHSTGDEWNLFYDGTLYSGRPGAWDIEERDLPLAEDEPAWLLQLIEGCRRVEDLGLVEIDGRRWRHAALACDLEAAAGRATRAMMPPSPFEDVDLAILPVEVWVDMDGRLNRAVLHRRQSRGRTALEIYGFGEAEPIPRPRPEEVES